MALAIIQLARSFYLSFIRMFPLRIVPGGTKRMEGFVKIDKELDELITRLTQLDKDMIDNDKILSTAVNNLITKVNELDARVGTLESKVSTLESKVATIETKITTIETKISGLETQISGINTKITNLESTTSTLQSSITNITNLIGDVRNSLPEDSGDYIKFVGGTMILASGATVPGPIASNTKVIIEASFSQAFKTWPRVVTDAWVVNTNKTVNVSAVGPIYHHLEDSGLDFVKVTIFCTNGPECKEGLGMYFHAIGRWK